MGARSLSLALSEPLSEQERGDVHPFWGYFSFNFPRVMQMCRRFQLPSDPRDLYRLGDGTDAPDHLVPADE